MIQANLKKNVLGYFFISTWIKDKASFIVTIKKIFYYAILLYVYSRIYESGCTNKKTVWNSCWDLKTEKYGVLWKF